MTPDGRDSGRSTGPPKTRKVTLRVPEPLIERLDDVAEDRFDGNRSEATRAALSAFVSSPTDASQDTGGRARADEHAAVDRAMQTVDTDGGQAIGRDDRGSGEGKAVRTPETRGSDAENTPADTEERSEAEIVGASADQLAEALLELEAVDINPLLDDDVRTFLDAKGDLSDLCLRLRRRQRWHEDNA